ncbi:MAG: hypothetical protein RIM99_05910 [Cyclobacteriaceae bacterium]
MMSIYSYLIAVLFLAVEPMQDDCKVNKYELQGEYSGGCKGGLANGSGIAKGIDSYNGEFKNGWPNGTGTYTYSNKDIYVGQFKKGLRHGKGELRTNINGKDTVLVGKWRDDDYVVPPKKTYEIFNSRNIDKVTVTKTSDIGNRVEFSFMNARGRNSPDAITVISESGSYQSGFLYELDFPVLFKVNYSITTSLGSSTLQCVLEMKIHEPGNYKVTLKTQ